jgi:hypothetical protein
VIADIETIDHRELSIEWLDFENEKTSSKVENSSKKNQEQNRDELPLDHIKYMSDFLNDLIDSAPDELKNSEEHKKLKAQLEVFSMLLKMSEERMKKEKSGCSKSE